MWIIKVGLYGLLGALLVQAGALINSLIFWAIVVTVMSIDYVSEHF